MTRDTNPTMDLSVGNRLQQFTAMLNKAERMSRDLMLNSWQEEFVRSVRENMDNYPGIWSPTLRQWNTLHGVINT